MASVGLRGSIRFLLTLGLVPAFYILQHGGVDGFPVAEGCSGAGPYAPAPAANVLQADEAVPVSVSTEGLFITQVFGPQVTASNSTLTVEVTTLNGDAVAGATKVLKAGDQNAMVGWKANAPLEVGTKLTAKVSVTDPAGTGDEVTLEVAGAPTALSASGLSFGMWMDIGHGVGSRLRAQGAATAAAIAAPGVRRSPCRAGRKCWTRSSLPGRRLRRPAPSPGRSTSSCRTVRSRSRRCQSCRFSVSARLQKRPVGFSFRRARPLIARSSRFAISGPEQSNVPRCVASLRRRCPPRATTRSPVATAHRTMRSPGPGASRVTTGRIPLARRTWAVAAARP